MSGLSENVSVELNMPGAATMDHLPVEGAYAGQLAMLKITIQSPTLSETRFRAFVRTEERWLAVEDGTTVSTERLNRIARKIINLANKPNEMMAFGVALLSEHDVADLGREGVFKGRRCILIDQFAEGPRLWFVVQYMDDKTQEVVPQKPEFV